MKPIRVEFHQNKRTKKFTLRLLGANGEIMLSSGRQCYTRHSDVVKAFRRIAKAFQLGQGAGWQWREK